MRKEGKMGKKILYQALGKIACMRCLCSICLPLRAGILNEAGAEAEFKEREFKCKIRSLLGD